MEGLCTQPDGNDLLETMETRYLQMLWIFCVLGLVSCVGGSRYLLRGHAPSERANPLPPLVMRQGETRRIISEWGWPMKFGYSPGLASGDPSVVKVEYSDQDPLSGSAALHAVSPGRTRVSYVNGFQQHHWPGRKINESSTRDSFEVRVLPSEPSLGEPRQP